MDFIQVLESLRTIKKLCQEMPDCKQCRLHSKHNASTCGVSPHGVLPAEWEFDLESEVIAPSIFK